MTVVMFIGGTLKDVLKILESCECRSMKILHAQIRNRVATYRVEIDIVTKEKLDRLKVLSEKRAS